MKGIYAGARNYACRHKVPVKRTDYMHAKKTFFTVVLHFCSIRVSVRNCQQIGKEVKHFISDCR